MCQSQPFSFNHNFDKSAKRGKNDFWTPDQKLFSLFSDIQTTNEKTCFNHLSLLRSITFLDQQVEIVEKLYGNFSCRGQYQSFYSHLVALLFLSFPSILLNNRRLYFLRNSQYSIKQRYAKSQAFPRTVLCFSYNIHCLLLLEMFTDQLLNWTQ